MTTIKESIVQLLSIVERLQRAHPQKSFTLDGRLVGNIGEVLCSEVYDITIFPNIMRQYDAKTPDGRNVQIKTTLKDPLTFPADHIPDYYLGIKIDAKGTVEEIFNGPGCIIKKRALHRRATIPKNNLHCLSLTTLRRINALVSDEERIKRREA